MSNCVGGSPGTLPLLPILNLVIMADEYSPSSPVNSNSPEVERDLIDGLHGAQEHDQSASEENEQPSEIGCPCVSPKSFPFTTVVKRKS